MFRNKNKSQLGFSLIELMVVVAIIALLSSIALIAFLQAREKARNAKRLGDLTQMNTALELYFASNKGYPAGVNGIPQNMAPTFLVTLPSAPNPADGVCDGLSHSTACSAQDPTCAGVSANTYFYTPSGTPANINGVTVYPDYAYFFCLGDDTGNFSAGERIITPRGVK